MPVDLSAESKRLTAGLQGSKKLFNQLKAQSRAASVSSSSTLFGMLGGFTGTGIAYYFSLYTSATFITFAPILAGAGIVVGVLTFRGANRLKTDSKLEAHKHALESIRDEIRLLPKNAPQAVKDEAWEAYRQLLSTSPLVVRRSALPAPQQAALLPPPHPAKSLPLPQSQSGSNAPPLVDVE